MYKEQFQKEKISCWIVFRIPRLLIGEDSSWNICWIHNFFVGLPKLVPIVKSRKLDLTLTIMQIIQEIFFYLIIVISR